ncbi:hypothetical protein SOVF_152100 [Spinacia oleracea]|nr:hypothetical protein SOVF_152100 [Spinacia oleracea]
MLQSRLRAAIISKTRLGTNWGFITKRLFCEENSAATQGVAETQGYAPLPTGLPADPALHSSDPPQGEESDEELKATLADVSPRTTADKPDPLLQPKAPVSSSPNIGHTGVGGLPEPNTQQRRQLSNRPDQSDGVEAQKAQKRAQEEDNKEYFKHHKASPLSEIEFADTRKPVTQATDSPTSYYGKDSDLILWKPEQLDTAEDSLLRAVEIWQWNKMRGDPDSPHGRIP